MAEFTVSVSFDTLEKAEAFMDWMDGAGEQYYWQHCEDAEVPRAKRFKYFESSLSIIGE